MDQRHVAHPVGRKQTAEYIRRSPSLVNIVRRQRTSDGAGGWTWQSPVTIARNVQCRFIPQETTAEQLKFVTTADGREVEVAYSVLFLPDVNLLKFDQIIRVDDGSDWFVGKLFDVPSWRRVAHVGENVG